MAAAGASGQRALDQNLGERLPGCEENVVRVAAPAVGTGGDEPARAPFVKTLAMLGGYRGSVRWGRRAARASASPPGRGRTYTGRSTLPEE
jgi:hypothetical protein